MSEKAKGRKHTPETKEKLRLAAKLQFARMTPEEKEEMKQKRKSPERIQQMLQKRAETIRNTPPEIK